MVGVSFYVVGCFRIITRTNFPDLVCVCACVYDMMACWPRAKRSTENAEPIKGTYILLYVYKGSIPVDNAVA